MRDWLKSWYVTLRMRLFRRDEWHAIRTSLRSPDTDFIEATRPDPGDPDARA